LKAVDLHKIPNICLAKISNRHQTNLFFPELCDPDNPKDVTPLTQQQMTAIYEKCVRQALLQVAPTNAGHIPVCYQDEKFRVRHGRQADGRIQYSYGTVDVAGHLVNNFGRILKRLLLRKLDFAKGCFFVHQIRGTRAVSEHDGNNQEDREQSFTDWVKWASEEETADDLSVWYADVGLEVRIEDGCLQWRADAHRDLLSFALPGASEQAIQRLCTPHSTRYDKDTSSNIEALAGFRAEPKSTRNNFGVVYVNCYTTDKQIMYHPSANGYRNSKGVTAKSLLNLKDGDKDPIIEGMFEAIHHAQREFDGHARIEMRLPIAHATSAFQRIPDDLLRRSLILYNRETWW
jgi:hypothetical protein